MNKWVGKGSYLTKSLSSEKQLSCKGIQIQLVKIKGKSEHYHKSKTEFFYFLRNGGVVIIAGKKHRIRKGMIIVIKPYLVHSFVAKKGYIEALMVKTNHNDNDTFYK